LITDFPEDTELMAELKRMADELDVACAQRDEYFAELQRERQARRRLTRRLSDVLQEEGLR
jgi:hypothetical protein